MERLVSTVGSFALVFFLGMSAYGQKADVSVSLGRSETHKASKYKITFLAVKEDSRCLEDTQCIWAGRAVITVKIDGANGSKTADLELGSSSDTVNFGGRVIKLVSLEPKPTSGEGQNVRKYVARFSIGKDAVAVCSAPAKVLSVLELQAVPNASWPLSPYLDFS